MLQSLCEVKIMRERLQKFMYGRYGTDEFGHFNLWFTIILYVANLFIRSGLLSWLAFASAIYGIFRMFSRNHQKRYQENLKFINFKSKIAQKFRRGKSDMQQRKTHHIYRCPTCGQKIRIPKGKGRICITCPKCKTEFTKTSW